MMYEMSVLSWSLINMRSFSWRKRKFTIKTFLAMTVEPISTKFVCEKNHRRSHEREGPLINHPSFFHPIR